MRGMQQSYKPRRDRFISLIMAVAIAGFGISLSACIPSIESSSEADLTNSVSGPFWPPPPQKPRIQYLAQLSGPGASEIKKTWIQDVLENIFGKEPKAGGLLRPYGIFSQDNKVFITDPGLGVLHVFHTTDKKLVQIRKAGDETFNSPIGVAVDTNGEIYVADSYLRKVFVFDREGKYLRQIGSPNILQRPTGIALLDKKIYIVDTLGHTILVFSKTDGSFLTQFGKHGAQAGDFNYPTNISISPERQIYVMDSMNFRVQVFNEDSRYIFSFGKHGDGTGDFSKPKGIAIDSEGHIYVADAHFDVVQIFDRDGRLLLVFGSTGTGRGEMSLPAGIYIDRQDRIYVADSYNKRIQIFQYLREDAPISNAGKN
jgi:DNA-binding beta-propeller fold protein YncE